MSVIGLQLTAVAVPVQVYAITRSSFWVGLLGAVGLVPIIVFGLWGGAVADAVDRRRLVMAAASLEWLCTLALLVHAVLGLESLPVMLTLVAVQAGAAAVASSTWGAVIPRIVPPHQIAAANTLSFTSSMTGSVIGPLLAGVLLARWSFTAAYALDAVLFTVALYAAVRLPRLAPLGRAAAGLTSNLWVAVALLGLAGAADLVSAVYRQTILQTYAPDEMRGRMQGVFIVVVTGGPRLGDLRAGTAAAAFGLSAAWVGGGLVCAVLVVFALLAPSLRHYEAPTPTP